MHELQYRLSFNTPAFLGDARQQAHWRTPPIKALLRQWWRVVKAKEEEVGYDAAKLLEQENKLFGVAGEKGTSQGRSRVWLRLSEWTPGQMNEWPRLNMRVRHPEVDGGREVGADLYLGYGPLVPERGTALGRNRDTGDVRTAIAPTFDTDQAPTLLVRMPKEERPAMERAIQLMAWFGCLGSRSRNGFGSLNVFPLGSSPSIDHLTRDSVLPFCRSLSECLRNDWPHAIGASDDGVPAVWKTPTRGTWQEVLRDLAHIKIQVRHTATPFQRNKEAPKAAGGTLVVDRRHLLGYPVTHHGVSGPLSADGKLGWVDANGRTVRTDGRGYAIQSARLASQLRFKVARGEAGGPFGLIVHLPAALPAVLKARLSREDQEFVEKNEHRIWLDVYAALAVLERRNLCARLP